MRAGTHIAAVRLHPGVAFATPILISYIIEVAVINAMVILIKAQ